MDVLSVKQAHWLKRGEVTKTIHAGALEGRSLCYTACRTVILPIIILICSAISLTVT